MTNCIFCGKEIIKEGNKFCNQSCSAKHNNRLPSRKRHNRKCLNCAIPISNPKYCSIKCQMELQYKEKLQSGNDIGKSTAKKYLISNFGRRCSVCDLSEWNGKEIPIELDHIDGNSENNSVENLRLICPNCHAQTPTYKGANKGNGRHYRKQRYRDGKSY